MNKTLPAVDLTSYIKNFTGSALGRWANLAPWQLAMQSESVVRALLAELPGAEYILSNEIAVHRTANVESGAVLKGPLILGPRCFVAAGAYLRGGCWAEQDCIFGPGAELKSSFVFSGSKLAHFNFVGDSILGSKVNLEAGSIICNYRNERAQKEILVRINGSLQKTGCEKFGALVGDDARIGANAVLAPGTLLPKSAIVGRTRLCDQELDS